MTHRRNISHNCTRLFLLLLLLFGAARAELWADRTVNWYVLGPENADGNRPVIIKWSETRSNNNVWLPERFSTSGFGTVYSYWRSATLNADGTYTDFADKIGNPGDSRDIGTGDCVYVTYTCDERIFSGDKTFRVSICEPDGYPNQGNIFLYATSAGIFGSPYHGVAYTNPDEWLITGDAYAMQLHPVARPEERFAIIDETNVGLVSDGDTYLYDTFMFVSKDNNGYIVPLKDGAPVYAGTWFDWYDNSDKLTIYTGEATDGSWNNGRRRLRLEVRYNFHLVNSEGRIVATSADGQQGQLPTYLRSPRVTGYTYYRTLEDAKAGTDEINTGANYTRLSGSIIGLGSLPQTMYVTYKYDQTNMDKVYTFRWWGSDNRDGYPYWTSDDYVDSRSTQARKDVPNPAYWTLSGDPYEMSFHAIDDEEKCWTLNGLENDTPLQVGEGSAGHTKFMVLYRARNWGAQLAVNLGDGKVYDTKRLLLTHQNEKIFLSETVYGRNEDSRLGRDYVINAEFAERNPTYKATFHILQEDGTEVETVTIDTKYGRYPADALPDDLKRRDAIITGYYHDAACTDVFTTRIKRTDTDIYVKYRFEQSYVISYSPIEGPYNWFNIKNASGECYKYDAATQKLVKADAGDNNYSDELLFAFVGDVYSQKIINKAAGTSLFLSAPDGAKAGTSLVFSATNTQNRWGLTMGATTSNNGVVDFILVNTAASPLRLSLGSEAVLASGKTDITLGKAGTRYYIINESAHTLSVSGLATSAKLEVPYYIKSPLVRDEDFRFYAESQVTESGGVYTFSGEPLDRTSYIPSIGEKIYVTYTYDPAYSALDLSGEKVNYMIPTPARTDKYSYLGYSNTWQANHASSINVQGRNEDDYTWHFQGNDPYNIYIALIRPGSLYDFIAAACDIDKMAAKSTDNCSLELYKRMADGSIVRSTQHEEDRQYGRTIAQTFIILGDVDHYQFMSLYPDYNDEGIYYYISNGGGVYQRRPDADNITTEKLIEKRTYTYHVITIDRKKEALSITSVVQELCLPDDVCSPVLHDGRDGGTSDYRYYSAVQFEDGTYTFDEGKRIYSLSDLKATELDIYVSYTYDKNTNNLLISDHANLHINGGHYTDPESQYLPIDLTGSTWYNILWNAWDHEDNAPYSAASGKIIDEGRDNGLSSAPGSMWKFEGSDPYDIKIYNLAAGDEKFMTALSYPTAANEKFVMSGDESHLVTSFMLLSVKGTMTFVATEHPEVMSGYRWEVVKTDLSDTPDNIFINAGSYCRAYIYRAPVERTYTFHAVSCDDKTGFPKETWSARLKRSWLTPVTLQDDIARLYALYEKAGTTDEFVRRELAEGGRFYSDAALSQRIYDSANDKYDVYPQIAEGDTYHIYFKYKSDTSLDGVLTNILDDTSFSPFSTEEDIAADVAAYVDSERSTDWAATAKGNWFFMVLDTDGGISKTTEGNAIGNQYFLRRENDGRISWLQGTYALHKDEADNYQTWDYNRLAEWNREGDNEVFREGRWLWTFVGDDPYNLSIVNFEAATGVKGGINQGYELAGSSSAAAAYEKQTFGATDYYSLSVADSKGESYALWGLSNGYGEEGSFSLSATDCEDPKDELLYWKMRTLTTEALSAGVELSTKGNDRTCSLQILPYQPTMFEDVEIVIRRTNDAAVTERDALADDDVLYTETGKHSGITASFASAKDRRFVVGDVIKNTADGSSIPEILTRKFCSYAVWRDRYANKGDFTVGDEAGVKKIYVSYDVTTDMFLAAEPTKTELARMARENDHVYFMDFRDASPTDPVLPRTSYDSGYHAYYKTGNKFDTDLQNRTVWNGKTGADAAYDVLSGYNDWVYQTTTNRMESVPENLKWYFVGDPYALQVFNVQEPGNNLARFDDTETNYQFILDCVHLRASEESLPEYDPTSLDGNAYDLREVIDDLDENGEKQYDDKGNVRTKPNKHRGYLRFPKFYWEVVPCRSEKPDAFALRFKADNTSLSYENVYYYLAHNGITRTYTKFVDRENRAYNIDLSYDKDNALEQSDLKFQGLHAANNDKTIIRLVQPTRVYTSAFRDEAQTEEGRVTRDELSEYFGLNEALDNVPRHYRRKYADYYNLYNLRNGDMSAVTNFGYVLAPTKTFRETNDEKYTYTYNYSDAGIVKTSCTDGKHPTFTKNPTFKFNVSYQPLSTPTHPYPFTTAAELAAGEITWTDINIGTTGRNGSGKMESHYLYSDKYNTDEAYVAKFDSVEYLKGMHWALVGDPYDFQLLNRRQHEGRIADDGTTVKDETAYSWLGRETTTTAKGVAVDYTLLTDKANAAKWSLCYFKTGGDADYFVRSSSPKTKEDENEAATVSSELWTNDFLRLTTSAVKEDGRYSGAHFYTEPFDLTWSLGDGENTNARALIYTVPEDGDEKTNDVFDANVYVYKAGADTPVAYLRSVELPYGDAIAALPWSLRRFGCEYTCYLDYNAAKHMGTLATTFSDATDGNIAKAVAKKNPVDIVYIYEVTEDAQKFFTTSDEAQQDAYNWTNGYYFWPQAFKRSSQEGIVTVEKVKVGDHVNEDGKIDGEIYEYVEKTIYPETDGVTDAYGWINSHTGDTEAFADQRTQTDNNDQKWALIGDPYSFEMKNYQFYLDGVAQDLLGDTSSVGFSMTDKSRWTIAIDDSGETYLALCDENGNIIRYITFDRVNEDGSEKKSSEQLLKPVGYGTVLKEDPTGNHLNIGTGADAAKGFHLAGLKNVASVVIYHLIMGHQSADKVVEDYYAKALAYKRDELGFTLTAEETTAAGLEEKLTDTEIENLQNDYGLSPLQVAGLTKDQYEYLFAKESAITHEDTVKALRKYFLVQDNKQKINAAGYVYTSYNYYEQPEVNTMALHYRERQRYGRKGTTLRDYITFPVADYVSYDVGVGNRLSVPWYMRRQFCNYTCYRRDELERRLVEDSDGNPILDSEGQQQYTWHSVLTDEEKAKKVVVSSVLGQHKDRLLIIDVVYDVDNTQFRFSDKGRNTTAWYSLMTQNAEADGLMNFSYKDGIGARPDRTTHYTNNYLWAPVGDPYGFTLHNRYATINGTGWTNVVVTTMGTLPQTSENADGTLDDPDNYDATYTSAGGKVRYVDSRIIHLGQGEKRLDNSEVLTAGATNAVYEMLVSNFPKAFLMHPTSAPIDVTNKEYYSNFMYHEVARHKSDLRYGKANTFRNDPEASWRLETTAEQLWPYFERSGYVGGLRPTIAMRNENRALRASLSQYVADPNQARDFDVLDRARELVYSGDFYNAEKGTKVEATDARPAEGLTFKSTNLVNMEPGYYRIRALSQEALNADGEDMSNTGIRGIVGPRYISGYRHLSESKIESLADDGTPQAGGRWLHFYETDEEHSTLHTFQELNDLIERVDAAAESVGGTHHNLSGRDITPHPAMRGNIELLPVEYDPSSIFYFNTVEGDALPGRYTLETQGLRVRGRAGGTQTPIGGTGTGETVYGVTQMVTPSSSHTEGSTAEADMITPTDTETYGDDKRYNIYDDRFRIDDIGGTAMTLRLVDPSVEVMRTDGGTTKAVRHNINDYKSFEETLDGNIKTNYLCIDRTHRYRITVHWNNEMVEIGDHHTSDFSTNGIQDTKWLLQPVGTRTDEFYNEMPLRAEVHKGGEDAHDKLGETPYYYGTLFVPFDTRLTSTMDGAFTATYQPSPTTVNLTSVSTMNNMGNGQFIPGGWPVVIRTASPKGDAGRKYVELNLPNEGPTGLTGYDKYTELKGILSGSYLEETLPVQAGKSVMVFGLPFQQAGDATTYGETDNSGAYYAYVTGEDSRVGFFTNENWAREGWKITTDDALGEAAYSDSDERQDNQEAYEVTARTATKDQRSNLYIYNNKAYYLYDVPPSSAPLPTVLTVHFEGDDEEEAPELYVPDTPERAGYVFDTLGRLRAKGQTPESVRRNDAQLPEGVYIYRGKKIIVR